MDGIKGQQECSLEDDSQAIASAHAHGGPAIPTTGKDARTSGDVGNIGSRIGKEQTPQAAGLSGSLLGRQLATTTPAHRSHTGDDGVHGSPGKGLPAKAHELRAS